MRRDPNRIDRILNLIRKEWNKFPDWRLCQLLENVANSDGWTNSDLFYYDDDRLEAGLRNATKEDAKDHI